jgi:hypothetical protein
MMMMSIRAVAILASQGTCRLASRDGFVFAALDMLTHALCCVQTTWTEDDGFVQTKMATIRQFLDAWRRAHLVRQVPDQDHAQAAVVRRSFSSASAFNA